MPRKISEKEKRKIINSIEKSLEESDITVKEACRAHDIANSTYYTWRRNLEEKDEKEKSQNMDKTEKLIVEMKKEHPYFGQKKITMQLKRFHGIDLKRSNT